jgi:hypothetical protein
MQSSFQQATALSCSHNVGSSLPVGIIIIIIIYDANSSADVLTIFQSVSLLKGVQQTLHQRIHHLYHSVLTPAPQDFHC